jgi:cytoskeleton protein RodZ
MTAPSSSLSSAPSSEQTPASKSFEPPAVDQPANEPAVSEPSAGEQPANEPAVSEPPAADQPINEPTVSEPPAADVPPVSGGADEPVTVAPKPAVDSPTSAQTDAPSASVGSAAPTEVASAPASRDETSRVTVRAKSNSWIQIRDETLNRLLFTRLLREGDEYEVPNRPGLRLMTGNAGALEVLVDGKVVPSIGGIGEVRRNVELNPEKLKAGTAVTN